MTAVMCLYFVFFVVMVGVSSLLAWRWGIVGAAVVAVPIFRRLGLGSVLGYLAAGLVMGIMMPASSPR